MQHYLYVDRSGSHPYFVYTPETTLEASPVPLVVMLHGCTQTAADFALGTAMNLLAEQYGFVVLYPQQTSASNPNHCWNWFLPEHQQRGSGEPARIVGMITNLRRNAAHWTIDPARIYAAGISAGACMATILGATYPDLFAAIGVHSGLEYQAATNVNSAFQAMRRGGPDPQQQGHLAYAAMGNFPRVVPSIVFHGTNDSVVAPVNGDQVVQQWICANHPASRKTYPADFQRPTHTRSERVASGYSYTVATWNASNGDEVQSYWKIAGMGHAWSGGNPAGSYADPRGPSASLALYNFFMSHPMKREDRVRFLSQKMRQHRTLADFFRARRKDDP